MNKVPDLHHHLLVSLPFPDEIMLDIFSRLPILSLLRCKSVCKTWNNSIKNPFLSTLHQSQIIKNGANGDDACSLVLLVDQKHLYLAHNHQNPSDTIKLKAFETIFKDIPLTNEFRIVGSSNGFICLSLLPSCESFYVCNPITREMLKIPDPPNHEEAYNLSYLGHQSLNYASGFVYDPTTTTYKVIHTWGFRENVLRTGVEIFTLGSKTWKRVNDIPLYIRIESSISSSQVSLNGALHWHVYVTETKVEESATRSFWTVASMDIASEKFQIFTSSILYNGVTSLGTLGGCLCVVDIFDDGGLRIVVQVMQDYGVSWCILHDIKEEVPRLFNKNWYSCLKNVRLMNNGRIVLLLGGENQGYYDIRKKKFKLLVVEGISSRAKALDVVAHVGTLVSPIGANTNSTNREDVSTDS